MGRERYDEDAGYRRRNQQNHYRHEYEPEYDDYTEDEEIHEEPPRRRSSTSSPRSSYPPPRRDYTTRSTGPRRTVQGAPARRQVSTRRVNQPVRQRRFWPTFLIGCFAGIIVVVLGVAIFLLYTIHSLQTGNGAVKLPGLGPQEKAFSQQQTYPLTVEPLAHLLICDAAGKISLQVDPTASTVSLTARKTVYATDQNSANTLLQHITTSAQQPAAGQAPASCANAQASNQQTAPSAAATVTPVADNSSGSGSDLVILASIPATTSAVGMPNTVDLNLVLPPSMIPAQGIASVQVQSSQGDIMVDGISGVLQLKGNGNITAQHLILANGSDLSTNAGTVTFNGYLQQNPEQGQQALYIIHGEKGVDVTLPSNSALTLDVNVSSGTLSSDFLLPITKNQGGVTYHGPLGTGTSSNAELKLDVGLGNITIHKAPAAGT